MTVETFRDGSVTFVPATTEEHAAALAFVQAYRLAPSVNVAGLPAALFAS